MGTHKNYKLHDMRKQLLGAGLELPEKALANLWIYHKLLREANSRLNLSRIYNFENIVRKHYIDSLFVAKILKAASIPLSSPLLDIGSGPGLPGIPLAIYLPELSFILAESRQLRADFLKKVVLRLGLKNAQVHDRRISSLHSPFAKGAITRAVEKMPSSLERLEKSLSTGALFIFMKGPHCDQEIKAVQERSYPFQLILDRAYTLPNSNDHRRLVVWEKSDSTLKPAVLSHESASGMQPSIRRAGELNFAGKGAAIPVIESASNPRFKFLYDLRQSRHIKKHGQSLVCGPKLVSEFMRLYPQYVRACISSMPQMKLEAEKSCRDIPKVFFSQKLFKELDFIGTGSPLLLIDIPSFSKWNGKTKPAQKSMYAKTDENIEKTRLPLHIFLPLGNPENLGAALRSCAAFNVEAVILLHEASHPFHPKAIRSAAGHCFRLPLYQGPSLKELETSDLKKRKAGLKENLFYALDPKGKALDEIQNFERTKPLSLLVGSEGQGLPLGLSWQRLSIPMSSGVESFNTAVSLGIALYIISQKLTLNPK